MSVVLKKQPLLRAARREHLKKFLLGSNEKRGILMSLVTYVLLISIAFIFVYPVLNMLSTSLMPRQDLLDSSVKWIPSAIHLKNYEDAIVTMEYGSSLFKNLLIAILPTFAQVFVCSLAGYGFARYNFPLKKMWMGLLLLSFLLPPQVTMMPTYVLFDKLKLTGTLWAFIVPALLGQGFKSALFVLIFYNFHHQVPKSLIEAAEIDGVGHIGGYFKIAVPLSMGAVVVVTLFSFVWYWNENYLINLYLGYANSRAGGLTTLLLELQRFQTSYEALYSAWETSPNRLNDAIRMAGTMLAIAPLLILYFVLQKQFVQSVDKSGITGE